MTPSAIVRLVPASIARTMIRATSSSACDAPRLLSQRSTGDCGLRAEPTGQCFRLGGCSPAPPGFRSYGCVRLIPTQFHCTGFSKPFRYTERAQNPRHSVLLAARGLNRDAATKSRKSRIAIQPCYLSRAASWKAFCTGDSTYSRMERVPRRISLATCMPGCSAKRSPSATSS
jgi:hypothetical protein